MTTEQQAIAALRAESPATTTGDYVEWLEALVLRMRKHRDELFATNNVELEAKRQAQAELAREKRIADAGRALMVKYRAGGPYWAEMQELKNAVKAEGRERVDVSATPATLPDHNACLSEE